MVQKHITISEALQLNDACFIDVRSPSEFAREHVAGAFNIPLFNDQERHEIGIIYHSESKEKAAKEGLKIASRKLPMLVQEIEKTSQGKNAVLYCWRGGLRSKALSAILELLEIPSFRLEGGYKAYRRFIFYNLQNYRLKSKLVVLHGLTGVGKTRLLHVLEEAGYPVLDLEGLAGHRGSVFGHIGLPRQITQKNFDALLYHELRRLDPHPFWLVEGEGKKIGSITLPSFLVEGMAKGCHLLLEAPLALRSSRLLEEYTPLAKEDKQKVWEALVSLENRIGKKHVARMKKYLKENKLDLFVQDLCRYYYDELYDDSKKTRNIFNTTVKASNLHEAAEEIKLFLKKNEYFKEQLCRKGEIK